MRFMYKLSAPVFWYTCSIIVRNSDLLHPFIFCLRTGHFSFDADSLAQLKVQSESTQKSTYAYYFTEQFKPDPPFYPFPEWIVNNSAEHADDLPFVFGGFYIIDDEIYKGNITLIMLH